MKKIKLVFFGLICTVLIAIISCEKKVGKTKQDETTAGSTTSTTSTTSGPASTVIVCDTITYTKHIKPIIDADCLRCHVTGSVSGNTILENYDLVKDKAVTGRIKARVLDGPNFMPADKGQLPKAKRDLIQCWLNNGMKE
jgi:hypothetical protein